MIWAIILVVIVAVVVTFIIFARARKFDPGKTESGVYLNKWADVRIRVPEGFKTYKNAATDNAHEELYMKTSGTEAAMFGFAAFNDPDVDSGMEQMKQVFLQAAGVSKGVNITVSEVHYPKIAGKVFAQLGVNDLEVLQIKLRAILRKGGLRKREEPAVSIAVMPMASVGDA